MSCKNRKVRKPRKMSAGGILSSAATGASVGSIGGPMGTAAGAVIGTGIGIATSINESKLEQEQAVLAQQQNNLMQSRNTFNQGYIPSQRNVPLMPYGGQVNNETVELEKGEPFMQPNGQINSIPTNAPTHSQGGVDINLPGGTKILGKKVDVNGKQYKEMGRKLNSMQSKYLKTLEKNPTSIAANTSKRMLSNIQNEFDKLFTEQEETKGNFGNGGQTKYPEGGVTGGENNNSPYIQSWRNIGNDQAVLTKTLEDKYPNVPINDIVNNFSTRSNFSNANLDHYADSLRSVHGDISLSPEEINAASPTYYDNLNNLRNRDAINTEGETDTRSNPFFGYRSMLERRYVRGEEPYKYITQYEDGGFVGKSGLIKPSYQQESLNLNNFNTNQGSSPIGIGTIGPDREGFKDEGNLGNILGTIGSLAPTAYNLIQGSKGAQQVNPSDFYNPYENEIRSGMANRRYNIQPELEQNSLNQATYNRNLREGAPSHSQYLGGLQAGAISKSRADAQAISRQQNVNNEYIGQQAQMDASLGAQQAQTKYGVNQFNLQSDAAARNMTSTGLSQVSQFAQNKEVMNNQILRDAQKLGLMEDLISNYSFQNGKWIFKSTGQEQSPEDVYKFIKG